MSLCRTFAFLVRRPCCASVPSRQIRAGMLKSENDPFLFKNMDDAVSRFVASLD